MPIVRQPLHEMGLKSFFSLPWLFQSLWKFAVPSFRCQVHEDMLVPNSTVIHNRTKVLHLMGIQELKRVKSDNRDMNNLHSLNRSRSGFLNCVSCRKGKWEKCQSPSSLHSFGRGIAASVKQRVGKVYPVQAPQGLEPFCCCRQPWLNSWGSIWSQAEANMKSVSSAALCHSVLSVSAFPELGPAIPTPGTSLKLRQGAHPNTTSTCFAGDQGSTSRAGSIFSFPSEYQTLTEIWGLESRISCPLHSLPYHALLWSTGIPELQLSFVWIATKIL